jgi:release factor glutamine methyltransferase
MAPERAGAGSFAGLSAREAGAAVAHILDAGGIEGAARDARLLLLEALGISGADLLREPERRVTEDEALTLADFVRRRVAREPVSRILGSRGFYGRTFHITPATLDPRPCTETVIEAALEIADREGWRERAIRILDVGTGSGALLVTLLAELPLATGVGTDISEAALDAASNNARRMGVGGRATFLKRRTLEGVEERFDLLVSNPPYIPSGEIDGLEPEVRAFDPLGALDGGVDGLDLYRALAEGLKVCVPTGWALVEVGAGQAAEVESIFSRALGRDALSEIKVWKDLGQHARCVAVRTQCYPWC